MAIRETSYSVYPNGVRLLKQAINTLCRSYSIVNALLDDEVILFHKYPRYSEDMNAYTK